jgi:DNA-binding MarR family transcriptional regulator
MARQQSSSKPGKPSRSLEQEAYLSLRRTADVLARSTEGALKPFGISGTQYNILRILRGAGPKGLCCREAADRMLTHDPDVTRLLDRLERRGLIIRARASADRRVITVRITPEGSQVLAKLDKPIEACHRRQLGHLGPSRLAQLVKLLACARSAAL